MHLGGTRKRRWGAAVLSLVCAGLLSGAGGYVFFHKRIGDWMVLCSGKTHAEGRSCELSAPLPILTADKPQNVLVITEPGADNFRVELRVRDFLERAEAFCLANEVAYHRVVTDTPVEEFVLRQLKGFLVA